ncbi:hypothetical protein QJS04_geneDACA015406 [Acorus gramineus]|uniref:Morc S5 domain-containing protein n=1 Tax=Acorus gramineus TaxID=55184 RepID=A0AAV9A741_ACOGR|nr:hypothetical protein QJS04_geneDACA015406 [Acorus gramineus]
MEPAIKDESLELPPAIRRRSAPPPPSTPVIDLSSSDSDIDGRGLLGKRSRVPDSDAGGPGKRPKNEEVLLPLGFLDPLLPEEDELPPAGPVPAVGGTGGMGNQSFRQFWKAGDYERDNVVADMVESTTAGMDHVRVHPKFLHSNATSHKWALGAFAELLDNALDEVCHGATYVKVDRLKNNKDGTDMLLIEDDGGGMDPDTMRQCMSLGYSVKSKVANTIGQYGNGFKTSTMRLGADVIVFSRCRGKDGKSPTQCAGMLSYTFLRSTGKEDIVVPMFLLMKDEGTRIIIYNLWEDDQGSLELDFGADCYDIQIRGVNRDEKKIKMATQFPNSRHFLTYRHSLRSYASILYLNLPPGFKIILRGKEVQHHNIVDDMMLKKELTYRPQTGPDGTLNKGPNIVAVVTIGFVKDAKDHVDVQGFNVYHKNRLIRPFMRVWHSTGSDGRGVIGLLEANFIEPAHDKQGFERTTMLARLEARLINMQKQYWFVIHTHVSGSFRKTPPRSGHQNKVSSASANASKSLSPTKSQYKFHLRTGHKEMSGKGTSSVRLGLHENLSASSDENHESDSDIQCTPTERPVNGSLANKNSFVGKALQKESSSSHLKVNGREMHQPVNKGTTRLLRSEVAGITNDGSALHTDHSGETLELLKQENKEMKDRIKKLEALLEFEKDRVKSLDEQFEKVKINLAKANKENEIIIDIFSEEKSRRDIEEENLRKKVMDSSNTINGLQEQLIFLKKKIKPRQ